MIRGAIFDMDGTLLDSMYIWHTIGADYLRSLGIEPREDLAKTFKTFTLEQSANYYRDHYGVTLTVPEIIDGVNRMIEDFYKYKVRLKPGVRDFLQTLQDREIPIAIATTTDRYLVEAALERCGVLGYFSEIFTCAMVGSSKEEPKIYEAARDLLGTPTEATWVFEDAFHAACTAHNAGFPVAGIYDPSEKCQEELKAVSTVFLETFEGAEAVFFQ